MDSERLVNLSLDGGEEEGFAFEFDEGEDEVEELRWCVVGRFLCDRTIHVKSMMVRMADLWRPLKGVAIKEAKPGLFLFCFNHQLDMEEVLKNGPWTFDNHLLIMERMQIGVQIENIPLHHAEFWVQVHDLPTGLMKEKYGIPLGNFIGSFVEYDKNNNSSFWRQYMRLRVKVDVRLPLKKDTKVKDRNGNWCTVRFKYEKLGIFCFICGIMGHAENRCDIRFAMEIVDGSRQWSNELRAEPRRLAGRQTSRWLVEERGGEVGNRTTDGGTPVRGGGVNEAVRQNSGESSMQGPTNLNVHSNNFGNAIISNPTSQNNPINSNHCPINQKATLPMTQSLPTYSHSIPSPSVTPTNITQPSILPPLIFRARPNPTNSKSHVTPFNMTKQTNQSLATHHQQLNPIVHVSQPMLTPIFIPDPTTPPNSTTDHSLTPHLPKNRNLGKSSNQKPNLSHPPNDIAQFPTLMHGHVTAEDSPDDTEDMETHVERKRRREEEIKNSAVVHDINQHFLSASPGSQDCREQ
jgi:14-3-3 protein epsilon